MTDRETLTAADREYLSDCLHRDRGPKALRVIAALTAENERLRARIDSEFTHDQLLHEVSSYRSGMMAAESSLAAATALLDQVRTWLDVPGRDEGERMFVELRAFLANQPSAPKYKCFSCGFTTNDGRDVEEWQCPCGGCVSRNQPPAPVRCPTCDSPEPHLHPAVQYEGEAQICTNAWHASTERGRQYVNQPAAPLPGWDNIERKTAAPTRTVERLPPRTIPEDQLVPIDAPTRTEAEQAVLDAMASKSAGPLRGTINARGEHADVCRAELARRGVK